MIDSTNRLRVGVIGYGYWGPNLARNFAESDTTALVMIADTDETRLALAERRFPGVRTTRNVEELIADPSIDAIAIATPVRTHATLALQVLKANKHLWIEKPMTETVAEARVIAEEAGRRDLVCHVDHTFVYSGAVQRINSIVQSGELGKLYYYDSTRINLGLFQRDVNVIADLAVHDFSILDFLLNEQPEAVSASGVNHFPGTPENLAHLTLYYASGMMAHINVSWLSPVKVRQVLVSGSQQMIVYDDLLPSEKIKVYDSGVNFRDDAEALQKARVSYRLGDMWAPRLEETEPLRIAVDHFAECIARKARSRTDATLGVRVVEVIEAANRSMRERGRSVHVGRETVRA
jgi:predicted dehydrogenase